MNDEHALDKVLTLPEKALVCNTQSIRGPWPKQTGHGIRNAESVKAVSTAPLLIVECITCVSVTKGLRHVDPFAISL